MSATTVPAVRAALVDRVTELLAAANDTETVVTYGHPGQDIPDRFAAIADTDNGVSREQRTLPLRVASGRTETYDLRLILWVRVGDHDQDAQRAATEAVWQMAAVLDDGLRSEPTLGGLVTWALPTQFTDTDFLLNEGRAAEVIVLVTVNVQRS